MFLGFQSRFLKCSFHFRSLSSWKVAFSFALNVLFPPLTWFAVWHAIHNHLPWIDFLILPIFPLISSNCSSWHVLVSSFWAFPSFCALAFVGFLLLNSVSSFFFFLSFFKLLVTPMELYIWLLVWLVCYNFYMSSDEVFIFVIRSMSFRYLLSTKFVSYSYHIFIVNISVSKRGPVIICGFDSLLFLHRLRPIFAMTIQKTLLQKRSKPHSSNCYSSIFFRYEHII